MKEEGRKGQFVVLSAALVGLLLFTVAGTVYLATNRVQEFRYSNYREILENLRADYARLLTYSLKIATWDRAKITSKSQLSTLFNNMALATQLSSSTYGDTATIETKVKSKLAAWSNVTTLGLASYSLSMDLDAPNLLLLYNWNVPDSNSTIRKNLSLNLTVLGFTGFKETYTIALRAIINTTNLDSQWGGGSVSTISIRIVDGEGNPKNLLQLDDFYVYNLNAVNVWLTRSLSSVTYQGLGDYLLTLTTPSTSSRYFLVIVSDGKNLLALSSYHP